MSGIYNNEPVAMLESDDEQDTEQEQETGSEGRAGRKRGGAFPQRQRKAREGALQVLYEVDLVGHDLTDVRERQFDQMGLSDGAREFAGRLVDGVRASRETLDAAIGDLAPTWPVGQLPRVDINVLRLALYELLANADVPTGAIINEAVELAKRYGSENSGKFVNGVLGTVATRIESGALTRGAGAASLAPVMREG